MATHIAIGEVFSLFTIDTKLSEFGFSATDKWAIKWLIKNILITSFLICRFPLQRYINVEPALKWTLMGMALIAAWLPCLKAYPVVSVVLMCVNTFLFAIGPLTSISILFRNLRFFDDHFEYFLGLLSGPSLLLRFLYSYNGIMRWMGFESRINNLDQLRCYVIVLIYAWTVYHVSRRRRSERRQADGVQEEVLLAIRHLD